MIENHIALSIPPDPFDDLRPQREEVCSVCGRTGCYVLDGWYEDTCVETDENGAFLIGQGDCLFDAVDIPSGWICSVTCQSQAMYDHADDFDKEALKKVREACMTLREYGKYAQKIVNREMEGHSGEDLLIHADEFLKVIGDDDDNMPDWCLE